MSASNPSKSALSPFVFRHIGPREHEIAKMLGYLGYSSLDELTSTVVPKQIQFNQPLNVPAGVSEEEALAELRGVLSRNKVLKSFIGQGYYGTHTPKVIQRNVLENPACTPLIRRTSPKSPRAGWKCCSTIRRWSPS
jgi:glycine dehydrogenase